MKTYSALYAATRRLAALSALVIAGFAAPSAADAQISFGVGLMTGVPIGEFGDTVSNAGFGLGGNLAYLIPEVPVSFGIEAGLVTYGNDQRVEPWSSTIPDVTVNVETSNHIALGHVFLRLQPQDGIVRPYVDGFAGVNFLVTETRVEDNGHSEQVIASSTNKSDAAFSYGAGGGLMVRLFEDKTATADAADSSDLRELLLDLRFRWIVGERADYLTNGSVRRSGTSVVYDVKSSRTDMVTASIGVTFVF